MEAAQWFYVVDDRQVGPVSPQELGHLFRSRQLHPSTLVWSEGLTGWVMASTIHGPAVFESSARQATPGKMALGIVVTDLDGDRISFARANGRYWGKRLSVLTLFVGYLMAAFTGKKHPLHDRVSGWLVVNR